MKWILIVFLTSVVGVFEHQTKESCEEGKKLVSIIANYEGSFCVEKNNWLRWGEVEK